MAELVRGRTGWSGLWRAVRWLARFGGRRRLPHVDGLSDHLRRDVGLDGAYRR